MPNLPDLDAFESLIDLVDEQATLAGDRPIVVGETAAGIDSWTGFDLLRRSRHAAYRLHAAGVRRGDRVMTLASAGPGLGAAYIGLWRLGAMCVPLDARFSTDVVLRIATNADTSTIISDAADDVAGVGGALAGLRRIDLAGLVADSNDDLPADWEAQLDSWPRPGRDDLYAILYTSGTTGQPRGVMLAHRNWLEPWAVSFRDRKMRILVSLLLPRDGCSLSVMPMSHYFGLSEFLAVLMLGGKIVYPHSRSARALLEAMRRHQPTTFAAAPRFLEMLWTQFTREIAATGDMADFDRRRKRARRLPYRLRRRMFRPELALLGGRMRTLAASAAALPPDIQTLWESIGLPVIQGYGATEAGSIATTNFVRHPVGKVGKQMRSATIEIAPDGEILVSGPATTTGYWRDPEGTSQAWDPQGRYHTGDVGRIDDDGQIVLVGRKKNVIVLSNGLKIFPEDIERELHLAGLGETVVLETAPGRIEAVILIPSAPGESADLSAQVEASVRTANSRLTIHERIDSWRIWPEPDFPRTHTFKIRRDPVREWAATGLFKVAVEEAVAAEP